jgi:hypothetical protein
MRGSKLFQIVLACAPRPVVSEVLLEFKTAGVIDYTRAHLCLLDLAGLQRIAVAQ